MNDDECRQVVGNYVTLKDDNPDAVHEVGQVVAYITRPSYLVEFATGRRLVWPVEHIVRLGPGELRESDRVAVGYEQVRQQLLTRGVDEPVAAELATMQQCLGLLSALPEGAQDRAIDWLRARTNSDRAAAWSARMGLKGDES